MLATAFLRPTVNPFTSLPIATASEFYGRQEEIRKLYAGLTSTAPQSWSVVGSPRIGISSFLHHISRSDIAEMYGYKDKLLFLSVNGINYANLPLSTETERQHASLHFWRNLYDLVKSTTGASHVRSDLRQMVWSQEIMAILDELTSVIQKSERTIVLLIDNFEGVAQLPQENSYWLRSLLDPPARDRFACVLASQRSLFSLYPLELRDDPSSLPNLLKSNVLYLGMLESSAAHDLILQAKSEQRLSFTEQYTTWIIQLTGRHPYLLQLTCSRLYELFTASEQPEFADTEKALFIRQIEQDAEPLSKAIWRLLDKQQREIMWTLANSCVPHLPSMSEDFDRGEARDQLMRQGLIVFQDGCWSLFSELIADHILEQSLQEENASFQTEDAVYEVQRGGEAIPSQPLSTEFNAQFGRTSNEVLAREHPFTYLEGRVFDYLQRNLDRVCSKDDIKRVVWDGEDAPGDSGLQKIIERIREKIEIDPQNPRWLIAVRGQGYMLRNGAVTQAP